MVIEGEAGEHKYLKSTSSEEQSGVPDYLGLQCAAAYMLWQSAFRRQATLCL